MTLTTVSTTELQKSMSKSMDSDDMMVIACMLQ